MLIAPFKLVEYLAPREFAAPHLLCASDTESWSASELLAMGDEGDLERWRTMTLGYNEIEGSLRLREVLIKALYPELNPHQVGTFAGAEEAIFCTLSSLLHPGDHVIALTPCYQAMLEVPKLRGCTITALELKRENDWRIDIEAIKAALTPQTKWVLINFPHNITGQIINRDEMGELIALLDLHGIWLFSDEVYRLSGPKETIWPQPAACLYHRAISVGVLTKPYGLSGLRMGWIACQDHQVVASVMKMKHYLSICNSAPNEILSEIALKNIDSILERNNSIISDNLHHLDLFFEEYGDLFSWVRPQGGCVGFVEYHGPERIDEFCDRMIQKAGVLLVPASVYDYDAPYFRLGFGRFNLPEVLQHFEAFIRGQKQDFLHAQAS